MLVAREGSSVDLGSSVLAEARTLFCSIPRQHICTSYILYHLQQQDDLPLGESGAQPTSMRKFHTYRKSGAS